MEKWQIEQIVPAELTRQQWQAIHDLAVILRKESLPDDPPPTLDEVIQSWSIHPPVAEERAWVAWDAQAQKEAPHAAAYNRTTIIHMEENAHIAQVFMGVRPSARRQGLGQQLLAHGAAFAQQTGRRLLIFESNSNCPAGGAFLQAAGATQGLSMDVVQLDLQDADHSLLRNWIERAAERAVGFEIGFWDGPYPEDALEQVGKVKASMNEAPMQDLDVEDFQWTPEVLRQLDENLVQRSITRWTFYARETATGNLSGFTELLWAPGNPIVGQQGDTGVLNEYKNKGLGRWMKAAMLEKVLADKPDTRYIRTGNATTNEPMRKINQELGFKLFRSAWIWQMDVEQAKKFTYPA
jgi:mycothiol synthase